LFGKPIKDAWKAFWEIFKHNSLSFQNRQN